MSSSGANLEERFHALEARVDELESRLHAQTTLVSIRAGTYDAFLYGLAFAAAAAASGSPTQVFVSQWGLAVLRDPRRRRRKSLLQTLFGWMLPASARGLPLTHLNFGGTGRSMVRIALKQSGAMNVEQYLAVCADLGIEFLICPTSAATLGLQCEDFDPSLRARYCGMTEYLDLAGRAAVSINVG